MDTASQGVRTLMEKLNQLLQQRADDGEDNKSQCSVLTTSTQSAKLAVERLKERLKNLQSNTQSTRGDVGRQPNLSPATPRQEVRPHSIDSQAACSTTNNGDLAVTIAQAIADSMALTRVPTATPFVFYGDPLQYLDWEINFTAAVDKKGISDAEKLSHLHRFVGGKAKTAIMRYFRQSSPTALTEAKALLKKRFGNDSAISDAYRKELQNWPKIAGKDADSLTNFSDFLQQCLSAMSDVPDLESLNDRSENRKMVDKLPEWLANRWKRKVNDYKTKNRIFPKLRYFADFIRDEAEVASEEVTTESNHKTSTKQDIPQKRTVKKATTFKTQSVERNTTSKPVEKASGKHCVHCEMSNHNTADCGILAKKPYPEALQLVRDKHLCYSCLKPAHSSKFCQDRATCKRCSRRHPTCLHQEQTPTNTSKGTSSTTGLTPKKEETAAVTCGKIMTPSPTEQFTSSMIVPVWVAHKDNLESEVLVYALLDTQSNASFVLDQTCATLKCPTEPTNLELTTMTSAKTSIRCNKVQDLVVRGLRDGKRIVLPMCYTRQDIPIDRAHIPTPSKIRQWPYLEHITKEMSEVLDCDVGLLIGYNCPEALAPMDTVVVQGNQPFGIKTALGWSVVGTIDLRESTDAIGVSHRILTKESEVSGCHRSVQFQTQTKVKEKVRCELPDILKLLETDFKDIQNDEEMSQDDLKFISILDKGITQEEDGHISMPLPLKERPKLPDSRPMAEKRLNLLKKRLDRDPNYKTRYTDFMDELINLGHAEKITNDTEDGETWYIPHFDVYHPKKPDKLRVVFDCAARYQENCLNDHLLKAPDQMNCLIGVILRFRLHPIAITCDIERMFYQFRVHAEDRDYLRFLWLDEDNNTDEYRMTVHLFGATSSPGCATFGLRNLADRHTTEYPLAAQFIRDSFYVDDGITSVQTQQQAIQLAQQARELCSEGGVRLHKFTSNNREVLESIPPAERAKDLQDLDLSMDVLPTERTLGIKWNVETDCFQFTLNMADKPLTKRGVLSGVASIFDPLGFVAPFVLSGKTILQSCCKEKLGWDDALPEKLRNAWKSWQTELRDLAQVNIPRCITSDDLTGTIRQELHHFGDASTAGYGACTYLREVDEQGKVHCAFVMGKARVAPLKITTIPRMELQAAVTTVKISRLLRKELKLPDSITEYFWTDSKVVLGYIRNEARRFHVYVANRVQFIKESTDTSQWSYVPSEENPADYASRGLSAAELSGSSWLCGPQFLWQEQLPSVSVQNDFGLDSSDPEVKSCLRTTAQIPVKTDHQDLLENLVLKFSSWIKVINRITTLLKAVSRFKQLKTPEIQLRQEATLKIVKLYQEKAFAQDIKTIKAGRQLPDKSPLAQLDAFVDPDGLIRVGGRLKLSSISSDEKHPILLPRDSHITPLIIAECHKKVGHSGRTFTMNKVREEGYWIISLNKAVTSFVHRCVVCRKLRASTSVQKMANLPKDRTEPSPPFLICACDVFGPFTIKERRKELKYYGLLFTCMASRAVHVEILTDLSTDSFLNAFRCLVALRGPVKRLYSDRGTNFVGARRELEQAFNEMEEPLRKTLLEHQCEFIFNTPSASHMGGVWERQIRTIRNVLHGILTLTRPTLDYRTLRTLLYETAAVVNSRPLAIEGISDPHGPTAITPNQLLTQKTNVILAPPGDFTDVDLYSRKQWRRVQYLTNLFWKRWRNEYLMKQQVRQKWIRPSKNVGVGDVVLLEDSNYVRGEWRLARVTDVHPGEDGLVRRVTLRVGDGSPGKASTFLERPLTKIRLLVTNP